MLCVREGGETPGSHAAASMRPPHLILRGKAWCCSCPGLPPGSNEDPLGSASPAHPHPARGGRRTSQLFGNGTEVAGGRTGWEHRGGCGEGAALPHCRRAAGMPNAVSILP